MATYSHNASKQKFTKTKSNASHVWLKEFGVPHRLALEIEITHQELFSLYSKLDDVETPQAAAQTDEIDTPINEGWC